MRCVIVGGADIKNYEEIKKKFLPNDFFAFCDCGLRHAEKLERTPNLIVGDFDSYKKPETDAEIITLPREKDDTDTYFAARELLRRGFKSFILCGVCGNRLDHTLANIYILKFLEENGAHGVIYDDYSETELIKSAEIESTYQYFSLLNISEKEVGGVYIENAKYPLDNATIKNSFQYAVSNEPLAGATARVRVENGELLLIKTRCENEQRF